MTNAKYAWGTTLLLAILLTLSVQPAAAKSKPKALNRSLYIPVELSLCPHLESAILYVDDQVAGRVPGERIFQFTYYPELERLEPEVMDLRLEGVRTDGEPFLARLAITPAGIFTADQKIDLEMKKSFQKFRYKIDVRHEKVTVRLRCNDSCGHEPQSARLTTEASSEEEVLEKTPGQEIQP